MEWLSVVPGVLAALAVTLVPGLLVAWAVGLRGLSMTAIAPIFTATAAVVGAIIAGAAHVPWGPLPLVATAVVLAAAIFGMRRLTTGRRLWATTSGILRTERALPSRSEMIGITIGAVGEIVLLSYVWGRPDHVSQTIDAVFHLNAIRWIDVTGSASSFTVGQVDGSGFYPAGWHALVSATAQLAGLSPAVAVYCSSVAFAAAVWVPGCVYLTQQIAGTRTAVSIVAGVASMAFGAFPILLLDFGVLYPNMLVVAMLPAFLAFVAQALGVSAAPVLSRRLAWFVLLIGVIGLVLVHPSGLHAVVAFGWPMLIVALWRAWKRRRDLGSKMWPLGAILLGGLMLTALLWLVVHPNPATYWDPVQTRAQAIGESLAVAPLGESSSPLTAVFVIVGALVLFRARRAAWAAGAVLVALYLFVNVSAYDAMPFRRSVTGPWYNDSYRLAALLPVAVVPVVAVSVVWLGERFAAQRWIRSRRWTSVPAAVCLVCAVFVVGQAPNVVSAVTKARGNYDLSYASPLLSADEAKLLSRLPQDVPPGATIIGNPWTGTSLAFALADRRTVQLHLLSSITPDADLVAHSLRYAETNPAVCQAVKRLGVSYVLDFGTNEIAGGKHDYDGLRFLDSDGVAKVVDEVGDARLLRITACS
ncbi:DUF6541 family protein [Sinomonas albida]|uniref:DUF6541 family protein n=1 Tax=Sinomonas albida TaxID=369942 RepID=UPI003018F284